MLCQALIRFVLALNVDVNLNCCIQAQLQFGHLHTIGISIVPFFVWSNNLNELKLSVVGQEQYFHFENTAWLIRLVIDEELKHDYEADHMGHLNNTTTYTLLQNIDFEQIVTAGHCRPFGQILKTSLHYRWKVTSTKLV